MHISNQSIYHSNVLIRNGLFIVLILWTAVIYAQQPAGVVDVKGRVLEKIGMEKKAVSDAEIYVVEYGNYKTDQEGFFSFKIPKGIEIKIEVIPSTYKMLRPIEGNLDTGDLNYTVEVYVISGTVDTILNSEIRHLDEELEALKRKNELTERQLVKLDQIVLDTVLYFQERQSALQDQIDALLNRNDNLQSKNDELNDSISSFSKQLKAMRDSVNSLIAQLTIALEEKYLRQKEAYEVITNDLLSYLSALKDLRDWLPDIRDCYKSNQAMVQFNNVCQRYSEKRDILYSSHLDIIETVQHYWENPIASNNIESVYEILNEDIHDGIILPKVNEEVISLLKQYSLTGVRKNKMLSSAADQAFDLLDPEISALESSVDELNQLLKAEM